VRYGLADIPELLRTPLGRRELGLGLFYRAWPLLRVLASAHRSTVARHTKLVAVVGSLGKTTTARMVLAALTGDPEPRLDDNFFSFVAASVLRIRRHDDHAVVEVGVSEPGQMASYARLLRPDIVVVTSIASEHLRSFGDLDATLSEKAEMLRALRPQGLAVVNGDDPKVRRMTEQTTARVVTFGFGEDNDVRAIDVALEWPHGTRFSLQVGGRRRDVRIRLLGPQMVRSALAAIAVALAEGRDLDLVLETLATVAPTPHRLDPVALGNGTYVLRDEFKSTLESVHAALDVLAEIPARRRLVVLGDVSEPPASQGPVYWELGGRIAKIAERAVFVGHSYQRFARGATRAGMPRQALVDAGSSTRRAIDVLREIVEPGDVILLKGRDTQRLDRVALALLGHAVRCETKMCRALRRCDQCAMLDRGWNGTRVVI
jgi:UDP-N-acetylmuramyl pentapeptide synthase